MVAGIISICCRPTLGRYIREGLLFAALGSHVLLPCAVACGVYGDHSVDKDTWLMKPVCTLLGCVDARRLFCITCGQGSLAKNATFGASDKSRTPGPAASCTRLSNTGGRARGPVVGPRKWQSRPSGSRTTTRSRPGRCSSTTAAAAPAGRATILGDGGRWRRAPSRLPGGVLARAPAAATTPASMGVVAQCYLQLVLFPWSRQAVCRIRCAGSVRVSLGTRAGARFVSAPRRQPKRAA